MINIKITCDSCGQEFETVTKDVALTSENVMKYFDCKHYDGNQLCDDCAYPLVNEIKGK